MLDKKQREQYGEVAYGVLREMLGGDPNNYFQSTQTTAMAWIACQENERILNLVGMYLWGDFSRAEINIRNLRKALAEIFEIPDTAIVEQGVK